MSSQQLSNEGEYAVFGIHSDRSHPPYAAAPHLRSASESRSAYRTPMPTTTTLKEGIPTFPTPPTFPPSPSIRFLQVVTIAMANMASGSAYACSWTGCERTYKRRDHLERHERTRERSWTWQDSLPLLLLALPS